MAYRKGFPSFCPFTKQGPNFNNSGQKQNKNKDDVTSLCNVLVAKP